MNWLSREETIALGWTPVHFLWQGTAIALAYAVIDRMTRRTSSSLRYLLALGALALMPLAVIGTFVNETRTPMPAETMPLSMTGISALNLDTVRVQVTHNQRLDIPPTVNRRSAWLANRLEPALPWIDGVWMIGISLLAIRAMGGWCHLQWLRQRARWFIPTELEDQFHQICRKMRLGRKISLRISEEVISPLAMGAWRATVILPVSAVLRMPPSELEAVLAHELAHIRRFDYLCNLFQTAVESVLFFHPAVWWLSRTVRERREVCCDEVAVSVCADPIVYAKALLRLEEEKTARLQLALALKGPKGSLLRRVKLVLGDGSTAESGTTGGVRVAAVALLAMGLLFGPKLRSVVAAPLITVSQTTFNHATPAVSLTAKPQSAAAPVKAKPGSEDQVEANISVTPMAAPNVDVKVNVNPIASANVVAADEATAITLSSADIAGQSSQGSGDSQAAGRSSSTKGSTYIEEMRSAGYSLDLNNDLDTLVALKSLGVTPEYAKSMAATGLGRPSVHDLIAMKSVGVTPEYLTALKQSGLGPEDLHEAVALKSVGVTPEYAKSMAATGLGNPSIHDLIAMKSLGITPEYLSGMKQSGLEPKDLHEAVALKSLGVTPEYAAAMKHAGYANLDAHQLITLKAQGMTPEHAQWLRQQFPQATTKELQQAAVFHIDDKFMADAKSHGFDSKDLDKLLRLKMSGLLDE